jgi:hypothetical protein
MRASLPLTHGLPNNWRAMPERGARASGLARGVWGRDECHEVQGETTAPIPSLAFPCRRNRRASYRTAYPQSAW